MSRNEDMSNWIGLTTKLVALLDINRYNSKLFRLNSTRQQRPEKKF